MTFSITAQASDIPLSAVIDVVALPRISEIDKPLSIPADNVSADQFRSYVELTHVETDNDLPKRVKIPTPQVLKSIEPKDYKVIIGVAGTRKWTDKKTFHRVICTFIQRFTNQPILFISATTTTGAGKMIIDWCAKYGFPCLEVSPNWDMFGKSAAYKRNDAVAENITHLLAFFDGYSSGTQDIIDKSILIDVPCKVVTIPKQDKVQPNEECSWLMRSIKDKEANEAPQNELELLGSDKKVDKSKPNTNDWTTRESVDYRWAPRRVVGAPEHPEEEALKRPYKAHLSSEGVRNPYHPNHEAYKAYSEGLT